MMDLDMIIESQEAISRLFENFLITSETPMSRNGRMFIELLFNNFVRFVGIHLRRTAFLWSG